MISALVSLNADLASSIAFRYACRLMEYIDMRLQPIHVEEVDKGSFPPGSGWVRSTWEKGLLQTAEEEIAQLVNAEKADCPSLDATIVEIGEYDEALLHEIEEKSYDLLVEGVLTSFHGQLFHRKIRSKLYRFSPSPIIVVKNLVQPDRVAVLLKDALDVTPLISTFLKLFSTPKASVDLIHFAFKESGKPEIKEKIQDNAVPVGSENACKLLNTAKDLLAEKGWRPKESWVIRDTAEKISEFLSDYGLIGACLPRNVHKDSLMLDLLSRIPSATLLCKK
jgi:nucleotide-binding universal stress UspA family protein